MSIFVHELRQGLDSTDYQLADLAAIIFIVMATLINKTLVGQTVVCYLPSTSIEEMERSAKIFSVTAVGRKYIKAGGREFEKDSLLCKQPFCKLFIGTPQEFSQAIRLMFIIRKQMEKLNLQQLEKLHEMVKEMGGD